MSKWKCDICGNEFENFHAQGFNGKIYCPLCYFKEENKRLQQRIDKAVDLIKNDPMKLVTIKRNKDVFYIDTITKIISILQGEKVDE